MRLNRMTGGAKRRAGKIAMLVAIALPTVLVPLLALGVDGGLLMEDRRKLQSAVDAAALAGAVQFWVDNVNYKTNSPIPPSTDNAKAAALAALEAHGYPAAKCDIRSVKLPAPSANPTINNKPGTIEVIATFLQPRGFSAVWGGGDLKATARAVARGRAFSGSAGILVLEDHDGSALYGAGSAHLEVDGAAIVVNSDNVDASHTNGNEIVLAAKEYDVVGGYSGVGYYGMPYPSAGTSTPITGSVAALDPLAHVPNPVAGNYPLQNAPPNGGQDGATITLNPGRYNKAIHYTGQRNVVLNPGFYYFEKGFELSGGANLTALGVCLFNAGSGNNAIKLAGGGTIVITPMASGVYEGISVFQSRTSDPDTLFIVQGNGDSDLTGTFYMPTTRCQITGTGDQRLGSQYICRTLEVSGSGTFLIDFNAARAPSPPVIELVE